MPHANAGKIEALTDVRAEAKIYMNQLLSATFFDFILTAEYPTKYLPTLAITRLSQRYKQTIGSQVGGIFDGYLTQIKTRFKRKVFRSSLGDEQRHKLFVINAWKIWFFQNGDLAAVTEPKLIKIINELNISYEDIKLARKILKSLDFKSPVVKNPTLLLDAKVAKLTEAESSAHFKHFLEVATLIKGHPVQIPVELNSYYLAQAGERKQAIQLGEDAYGRPFFSLIKEKPTKVHEGPITTEIGVDIGLSSLLSSSTGNQYGLEFFRILKRFDRVYQNMVRGRMRHGFYASSKEMNAMTLRIQDFVKNEIGKAINRFLGKETPDRLYIEDIKSIAYRMKMDGRLSKSMRRLLLKSGFCGILDKIEAKCRALGIEVVRVPPAYTSQTCLSCGHIDRNNRKGAHFKCTRCKKTINADTQAARHIWLRGRSYGLGVLIDSLVGKDGIKEILRNIDFHGLCEGLFSSTRQGYRPAVTPSQQAGLA